MQINEEEKKSIEEIRNWRNYIVKNRKKVNRANDIEFHLRTVLNLIEKQQRKITDLKIKDNIVYRKNYYEALKELEIKDKMIDEMAEFIDDNLTDCILNTMNIDEPCSKHANREMLCKECIKEYFRKKVE